MRYAVGQTLTLDGASNGRGALARIAAPAGFDSGRRGARAGPDDVARVLPGAELTETFKLHCAQIEAKYAAEVEVLYA